MSKKYIIIGRTLLPLWLLLFTTTTHAKQPTCDNFQASITTYDLKTNTWSYTDKKDAKLGTLPASTFKIFNSLIALDRGTTNAQEVFKWDGTKRMLPQWNQDMTLQTAFEVSAIWVHEVLANRVTPSVYERYLKWSNYGNGKIHKHRNGNFWVYGDFKVTPIEQIQTLKALYEDELPFSKATMKTVKSFMQNKEHSDISAKSGWLPDYNGTEIGWWIGWKMHNDSPLFFATRLRKPKDLANKDFLACRISLTLRHLDRF